MFFFFFFIKRTSPTSPTRYVWSGGKWRLAVCREWRNGRSSLGWCPLPQKVLWVNPESQGAGAPSLAFFTRGPRQAALHAENVRLGLRRRGRAGPRAGAARCSPRCAPWRAPAPGRPSGTPGARCAAPRRSGTGSPPCFPSCCSVVMDEKES